MQVEKLKTIDADTLLSTPMRKTLFVVDGLIPQGLSVLSGSSKIGKSWLMEDIHREEIPKFIFRLVDYISEIKEWRGTATQLITQVNETEVTPNVVTKILARFSSEVFQPQGIEYKTKRTGTSRLIYLKKNDGNDGDDNKSAI